MHALLREARRHSFAIACSAAALIAVGSVLWIGLQWGGLHLAKLADDSISILVPVAAAIVCWRTAARRQGRRRMGWALLGASNFSWGMGSVIWWWYEIILRHDVPFPSFADAGFLLDVPFAIAGVVLISSLSVASLSQVRTLLDGSITASALLFVSWATALGTAYSQASGSVLEKVIGLAYPLADVVTGSIVLFFLPRAQARSRMPLALLGLGILANTVSDSLFTYLQLSASYSSTRLVDAGWIIGFLLIGLAALREGDGKSQESTATASSGRIEVMLPYTVVGATMVLAAIRVIRSGSLDPFLIWTGMLVLVLVLARQFFTLMENLSLTRTLEVRVQERTAALKDSEQRFRSLVQNSADAIIIAGADRRLQYQSPAVQHMFGYPPEALGGSSIGDLLHPEDRGRLLALIDQMEKQPGATAQVEARWRHQDGSWRSCEMTIANLLQEPAVRGLVINSRDVTDRKALEEQLAHQAFHDSLTGIANRALFKDRLRQTVVRAGRRKEKPALLFFDLDGFKTVNDSLGHAIGDELLAAVASRLRPYVRGGDTMARLGGDEFAILLEDTADAGAAAVGVAERIIDALQAPFVLQNKEVSTSASIGIALLTASEDADELLRNADIAMYMAKAAGKARYQLFNPSMHDAVVTQLQLEGDLQRALDRQEFFLVYQPLVSLGTGRPVGVEALLRWRHPHRDVVSPTTFIPLAEKTGAIVPIGRWVLREACQQVHIWQQRSPTLGLSVNLSGRQLRDPKLADVVRQALADSGMEARTLTLEITESVLMEDVESTLEVLRGLRALGIHLAIDDFGTGYSSLSYLRQFPVDSLKIDRSFVSALDSAGGEPLVATILRMGQTLSLEVVAEGIERSDQLDELKKLHCDLGQGFYFSKPVPAAEMAAFLAEEAGLAA
jgi:diguanylate cyclase (GGDEF)-like protein/PAS domain S-box-containing protein